MATIHPKPAAARSKNKWLRFRRPKLLILVLLFIACGVGLAIWILPLPPSWTADYDKATYTQIRRAIAADPQHLLGRTLAEITTELNLEDVRWDDSAVQREPGMNRIYHFRGFALHVTLQRLPPGSTPDNRRPWTSDAEELQQHGVLWLAHQYPFLQIDGINDRQERMARFWKSVHEQAERINAEMRRQRQQSQK